jgi:cytochrome c553
MRGKADGIGNHLVRSRAAVAPPGAVRAALGIMLLLPPVAGHGIPRAAEVDPARLPPAASRQIDFARDVRPIFAKSCFGCHGPEKQRAELRLDSKEVALAGSDSGTVIVPGDSAGSRLIHLVAGLEPDKAMPAEGEPLTAEQVGILRAWIDQGAAWPDSASVKLADKFDWWSLKPIRKVEPPAAAAAAGAGDDDDAHAKWVRNPVDAFVLATLSEQRLAPSPEADRRTLIRRAYFDLIGLPPDPDAVERFVADPDPNAYERLVDELLASPRYGERWARHWLDLVHYGDTHGYDKDKVRPNAWPYRDYVIRAFNEDKPYDRFVREQLAGDVFYPGTADGVAGLGFIAAGPFDFVGQIEVGDGTMEKQRVRNVDRDDMVSVAANTFVSLTAQCARCHNHKFDPISQEDYYSLQAVFAAVDRADRPFDADPEVGRRRKELTRTRRQLGARRGVLDAQIAQAGGPELASLNARIAAARGAPTAGERPEYGYHSNIEPKQDAAKWVQVDLGAATPIDRIVLVANNDAFNNIGPGFGFPVRYKVEASDDGAFAAGVTVLADHTAADVPNPGVAPQVLPAGGARARYVRVTATKLAPRQNDYIFSLAELSVLRPDGTNVARGAAVMSLDSIEGLPRWARANLVDGIFPGGGGELPAPVELAQLREERLKLLAAKAGADAVAEFERVERELAEVNAAVAALPPPAFAVYAAATEFDPAGSFTATYGTPRPVHLLHRGDEKSPRQEVGPGTVGAIRELPARFNLSPNHDESERRAALAEWVLDGRNPLTWRSIVNRVWYYHFGRGIVETPNDFGRMGAEPTHPELLDWLAAEFRDGGEHVTRRSIKSLHRLILTSSTYRQSSANHAEFAKVDGGNQYLWRQNRQRLGAEAIRDGALSLAGLLDTSRVGGPGFMAFGFVDDHSPHYKYAEHDPDDPASHRRSIYRLIVRSVPDPFMETLDCADPSLIVERRNETLTALQALALLNNKFMVRMAERFAQRVETQAPNDVPKQIDTACRLAFGRAPTPDESATLLEVAQKHGLANACRLIFNTNEFVFVD